MLTGCLHYYNVSEEMNLRDDSAPVDRENRSVSKCDESTPQSQLSEMEPSPQSVNNLNNIHLQESDTDPGVMASACGDDDDAPISNKDYINDPSPTPTSTQIDIDQNDTPSLDVASSLRNDSEKKKTPSETEDTSNKGETIES